MDSGITPHELMKLRHDATPHPYPTGDSAGDAEKITQWFLECAFFKLFLYRNPKKDPQKEFSDALIVFDDTIVIVQVKSKSSERSDVEWVPKHANKASKQLNGSFRQLKDGIVKDFINPVFFVKKEIDLSKYLYIYGVIIFDGVSEIIDPLPLIDLANKPEIPSIFISTSDLRILVERVNTAADFINYCEAHSRLASQESVPINQEFETLSRIASDVPNLLSEGRSIETFDKGYIKGFTWISRLFNGDVNRDQNYQFGLLVDDIISNLQDLDPNFSGPMNEASANSLRIAEQLGWLDRKRRIELGKLLNKFAIAASDGNYRILPYMRPTLGILFLFLFSKERRKKRRELLEIFVSVAQIKYKVKRVIGIATEPVGNGRSYDLILAEEMILKPDVIIPSELLAELPNLTKYLIED